MANSNPQIDLVSLDFEKNKQSLINYLKTIPEFSGYNFEGSNMSRLLDLLAYTTSQNAFYAHLVANEMFLDTANDRRSVVGHAKMLGYTPRSYNGARCTLRIKTNNTSSQQVLLPIGSVFTLTIDGQASFSFCTVDDIMIKTGSNVLNDFQMVEGKYKTVSYTLPQITASDSVFGNGELRLTIPDKTVDTTTLKVRLYSDDLNTSVDFVLDKTLNNNNLNGNVFSLQENPSGFFEVVLNRALLSGSNVPPCLTVASLSYVVTSGAEANNAFTGTKPADIKVTYPNIGSVTMSLDSFTEFPFGGNNIETMESIKLFAPRLYATQNRAVTNLDYKTLIQQEIPGIETIRVVGGETLNPPRYGQVFISLKYVNRTAIPQSVKEAIVKLLDTKGMSTIIPAFVEPDYIFVEPSVTTKYKLHVTSATIGTLSAAINTAIVNFGKQTLDAFDSTLWNVQFLDAIAATDRSIVSAQASYVLRKSFTASTSTTNDVTLAFQNELKPGTISSSSFQIYHQKISQNITGYIVDDTNGNLNIVWYANNQQFIMGKIGTVNYKTGTVLIQNFNPNLVPNNNIDVRTVCSVVDLASSDNSILTMDNSKISVNVIPVTSSV